MAPTVTSGRSPAPDIFGCASVHIYRSIQRRRGQPPLEFMGLLPLPWRARYQTRLKLTVGYAGTFLSLYVPLKCSSRGDNLSHEKSAPAKRPCASLTRTAAAKVSGS